MLPSQVAASPAYVRFRESHHAVARWFAQGLTMSMVCERTGYTRRRLNLLLADPTFQDLVATYHAEIEERVRKDIDVYDDLQRRNMIRAEHLIADRLDDEEEPLSVSILDRISQGRADRTGYSKHSTVKHEHSFADALDRAIERSGRAKVIDHEPPKQLAVIEARPPPDVNLAPASPTTVAAGPRPSFATILKNRLK